MTAETILTDKLAELGVKGMVVGSSIGPVVTQYEVRLAPGVRVAAMRGIEDDLAMALSARNVRIEAPIPGRDVIGIEVPNAQRVTVSLSDVLSGPTEPLSFALGRSLNGEPVTADLRTLPHLLVAGTTGSGKSVFLHALLCSFLRFRPEVVRFILVDPKGVELAPYALMPHMLTTPIEDVREARLALDWAIDEMEDRYTDLTDHGVRSIDQLDEPPPYIVIAVDELADLLSQDRSIEAKLVRLAQKARAAGIHLVLATQRPSVDVITGVLKANIPSRLAFTVSSGTDSRVIIDQNGAENLTGKGDCIFVTPGRDPARLQGVFVSDDDVEAVVQPWEDEEALEEMNIEAQEIDILMPQVDGSRVRL